MAATPFDTYRAIVTEIFPIDLPYCAIRLGPNGGRYKPSSSGGTLVDALWLTLVYELYDVHPSGRGRVLRSEEKFTELIVRAEEIAKFPERVEPYLRGWAEAMRERLSLSHGLEYLQTHTLGADSLRKHRGARTADDYRRSLLSKGRREWSIPGVPAKAAGVDAALGAGPIDLAGVRELLNTFALAIEGNYRLALSPVPAPVSLARDGIWLDLTLGRYARTHPSGKREKPLSITTGKALFLPKAALKNRRRVVAYLSGWKSALNEVLSGSREFVDERGRWSTVHYDLDHVTPDQLVDPDVLSPPAPSTAREYFQMFLRPASLGRWARGHTKP